MFDPRLMEFVQAGVQMYLAFIGIICSLSMVFFPKLYDDDKDFKQSAQNSENPQGSLPAFLSLSRQNVSSHTRASNRLYNRAPIGLPAGANGNAGGDSSDQVGGNTDERLRPMTPRRVKRRSARSIQSQRFGQPSTSNQNLDGGDKPSTSRGSSGGSGRSSLRSNASRRGAHHRNSKRKTHQFVSPVNRLMQQQQVDSETSHDEPRRYLLRDQVNAKTNIYNTIYMTIIEIYIVNSFYRVTQIQCIKGPKVLNMAMLPLDHPLQDLPTLIIILQDSL
jgi:hypothetical protein